MNGTVLLLVVGAVVLFALYSIYVKLIKTKNKVFEALSSIDVQLKKRYYFCSVF